MVDIGREVSHGSVRRHSHVPMKGDRDRHVPLSVKVPLVTRPHEQCFVNR